MNFQKCTFLIIASVFFLHVQAKETRDGLIAPEVAIFYPADFIGEAHLPSFALLHEPKVIQSVPQNWELTPSFFGGLAFTRTL